VRTGRNLILDWAEQGVLEPERIREAMAAGGVTPAAGDWRRFLDRLLAGAGAVFLAAAAIFFLAYNWHDLGRWGKFALTEAAIVAALALYWKLGPDRVAGKAALTAAALLVGALLALFGQTYQTGADPWQLFALWAVLVLPWAAVGRFAALWGVVAALANLAITLHFHAMRGLFGVVFGTEELLLALFAFNTLALAAWELGARRIDWLDERWALRLVALAGGTAVTLLVLHAIFEWRDASGWAVLAYPLWLTAVLAAYRRRIPDLFMLAGASLSVIVVVASALVRLVLDRAHAGAGGFLFIGLVVIGLSAAAAVWLRAINAERQT
jgi:uncharacterized membrane protein